MQSKKKISIIGAGNVGSTIAYTLMQQGTCSEILLVDINRDKAEGESLDLAQCAACFPSVKVRFGEYEDAAGSDIVIATLGVGRKPGQSRLDLAKINGRHHRERDAEGGENRPGCDLYHRFQSRRRADVRHRPLHGASRFARGRARVRFWIPTACRRRLRSISTWISRASIPTCSESTAISASFPGASARSAASP